LSFGELGSAILGIAEFSPKHFIEVRIVY